MSGKKHEDPSFSEIDLSSFPETVPEAFCQFPYWPGSKESYFFPILPKVFGMRART